jgi:DNA polymerase I
MVAEKKVKAKKGVKSGGKKKKLRLVLLDAHAILHRAYHALPDLASNKGEPTGALYGLSAMLIKIVGELKPDFVVACYDLPGPTYRHEAYKDYKAKRPKADGALVAQIKRSRDIFSAFGVPIYEKAGFEADDILGTIVEKLAKDKDLEIIIASGDMDTLQLVFGERVRVYTLRKGIKDTILYDEKAVKTRFGFPPKQLPDFKGLSGDPSDNIIGIKGIGEKTATALILNFGSIEKMYGKLEKDRKSFFEAGIKERIIGLLEENEEEALFSKELATIRRDAPIDFALPKEQFIEALDLATVRTLFSELSFRKLADRVAELMGEIPTQEEMLFEQNEVVDEMEFAKTAIALWLINSDMTSPTLEDIKEHAKERIFTKAKEKIFDELEKEKLLRVYEEIELPLLPITQDMTKRGIRIDRDYLSTLSSEYHKKLDVLEKEVHKQGGGEFNINSPKQLSEVLFDKLGLAIKNHKKTETGQRSTRESELEKLRGEHPIIDAILSYRELQKLLSTYIDVIPALLDKEGRLHASFLQTGTTTGRMSSQNPNIQNIPIRTDLGKNIRHAFIASPGFMLVEFDYSQAELRIAAFLSGDEKLIDIFKSGRDVHSEVAAQVFGVPIEMVDYEMRRRAKVINFGILYGMGVNALRANLGTDRAEAQKFMDEYFANFSGLAQYLEHVKRDAARVGYTTTVFGRKRHFEGLRSSIQFVRASAERMAINAPIQGTEADVIKLAMVRVDRWIKEQNLEKDVYALLQVHDELVYEVEKGKVDTVLPEIKRIMESVLQLEETSGVPLAVEAMVGENWGEMREVGDI